MKRVLPVAGSINHHDLNINKQQGGCTVSRISGEGVFCGGCFAPFEEDIGGMGRWMGEVCGKEGERYVYS